LNDPEFEERCLDIALPQAWHFSVSETIIAPVLRFQEVIFQTNGLSYRQSDVSAENRPDEPPDNAQIITIVIMAHTSDGYHEGQQCSN
jgi:hypothetical protein